MTDEGAHRDQQAGRTRPTELARRAAESRLRDEQEVAYQLVYGRSIVDALTREIQGAAKGNASGVRNLSGFVAAGVGVASCTLAEPAAEQTDTPTHAYAGRAVPNPGHLHDSSEHVEMLLTLGGVPWRPTFGDSLLLCEITVHLLKKAAECGSVLFMTAPVSPLTKTSSSFRGDGSAELTRDTLGPCVRLSVGIERSDPRTRLRLQLDVIKLADEFGFGLHFADRRMDRSRGEWYRIRGVDEKMLAERRRWLAGRVDGGMDARPERAYVLSTVGPARAGVAIRVAEALAGLQVGLLGMSISPMHGVGFVHFFLPARDGYHLPAQGQLRWPEVLDAVRRVSGPHVAMEPGSPSAEVVPDEGGEGAAKGRDFGPPQVLPEGYSAFVGPIQQCTFPSHSRRSKGPRAAVVPYPIWAAWEVHGHQVDVLAIIKELSGLIACEAESWELMYSQSRLVSTDLLRGRAKFSVVLQDHHRDQAPQNLVRLANDVQRRMNVYLATCFGIGQARCRVTPRERWLSYRRTGGGS